MALRLKVGRPIAFYTPSGIIPTDINPLSNRHVHEVVDCKESVLETHTVAMTQTNEPLPVASYTLSGQWQAHDLEIIAEDHVCLHVNGADLVTFACTPALQKELALGFLFNEGMINSMSEVSDVHLAASGLCVDVWLNHSVPPPARHVLTSGCGGGTTFEDFARTVPTFNSNVCVAPEQALAYMQTLSDHATLYRQTRGVHACGLFKDGQLVSTAEDVGRHNTVDKVCGDCALRGIDTHDSVVVTSGRVSSEMLNKAARMGCPIVVSRTSATTLAVRLARAWNMTLVGYARRTRMIVYSGAERLGMPASQSVL